MVNRFFLFGTLRERGGAGSAIKNLGGTFTESGILSGYEMWEQGWIPYILPAENSTVIGDLAEFPEPLLDRATWQLDTYEGYAAHAEQWCRYLRRPVKVQSGNAGLVQAWCYVANPDHVRPYQDFGWVKVPDGDYVKHTSNPYI